jgi:hypothetical protein
MNAASCARPQGISRLRRRSDLVQIFVLAVVACLPLGAILLKGNPFGQDTEFHLECWMEAAGQWHLGVVYPRWAVLSNHGFGEPRFVFYPPGSWMLGAALSFVLPWKMVPGALAGIAFLAAGISMWHLAREWLPECESVFAGALYALNPYHLLVFYRRCDFSELLASGILPLAVWFMFKATVVPRRAVPSLAVVVALVWLLSAPAAVIMCYSLALASAVLAIVCRRVDPVINGGIAVALGLCMAGIYIVPAAYEQRWVNISSALRRGFTFNENFLFTGIDKIAGIPYAIEHVRFTHVISILAIGELLATALAVLMVARVRRTTPHVWWTLLVLAVGSGFLMFSPSRLVWQYLPELRFIQFPWRWLCILGVPMAFFVAAAINEVPGRAKTGLVLIACMLIAFAAYKFTRINWRARGNVSDFYQAWFPSGIGYGGVPEYSPTGTDQDSLDALRSDVPTLVRYGPAGETAPIDVEVKQWSPERKRFRVDSTTPITLQVKLLNYPAWHVTIDSKPVSVRALPRTGQMLIPVAAGRNNVDIVFIRTPDRTCGILFSTVSLAVLLAYALYTKRTLWRGMLRGKTVDEFARNNPSL